MFTCKQSKTNTNKKPTSPYTAPAIPCHLVTTSLAKSLLGALGLPVQGATGRRRWEPDSLCASEGLGAARNRAPGHSRGQALPGCQAQWLCVRESRRLQAQGNWGLSRGHTDPGDSRPPDPLDPGTISLKAKVKNGKNCSLQECWGLRTGWTRSSTSLRSSWITLGFSLPSQAAFKG